MSTDTDGAPPSVAPESRDDPGAAETVESGATWLQAEIQRRMAAARQRRQAGGTPAHGGPDPPAPRPTTAPATPPTRDPSARHGGPDAAPHDAGAPLDPTRAANGVLSGWSSVSSRCFRRPDPRGRVPRASRADPSQTRPLAQACPASFRAMQAGRAERKRRCFGRRSVSCWSLPYRPGRRGLSSRRAGRRPGQAGGAASRKRRCSGRRRVSGGATGAVRPARPRAVAPAGREAAGTAWSPGPEPASAAWSPGAGAWTRPPPADPTGPVRCRPIDR